DLGGAVLRRRASDAGVLQPAAPARRRLRGPAPGRPRGRGAAARAPARTGSALSVRAGPPRPFRLRAASRLAGDLGGDGRASSLAHGSGRDGNPRGCDRDLPDRDVLRPGFTPTKGKSTI